MKFSLLLAVCLAVSVLGKEQPPPPPPPKDMKPPGTPGPSLDIEGSGPRDMIFNPPAGDAPSDDWMYMGSGGEERFEGDMVLTDEQLRQLNGTADVERNGIIDTRYHWPKGIVPYNIDSSFNSGEIELIQRAMGFIEIASCIKFVQMNFEINYLHITKSGGCWSSVGFQRIGEQVLSLDTGCMFTIVIQHQLMHALGFYHEQSRCDRDHYVTILVDNIRPGAERHFNKYKCNEVTAFGADYDYDSAMHFGNYAYTDLRLFQPTIQAKYDPSRTLGPKYASSNLTETDLYKLNQMYECSG